MTTLHNCQFDQNIRKQKVENHIVDENSSPKIQAMAQQDEYEDDYFLEEDKMLGRNSFLVVCAG